MWGTIQHEIRPLLKRSTLLNFTLVQLLNVRAYLGYDVTSWDFRVRSFLIGVKNHIYIYNLNCTLVLLKTSINLLLQLALARVYIAIINENQYFTSELQKKFDFFFNWQYFESTRLYFVFERLARGLFTNNRLDYLRKPLFKIFPESCIITSPSESKYLIDECQRLNLPTFCLIETNLFPTNATYLIPCNEKDHYAVKLYISLFFLVFAKAYLLRANMWHKRLQYIFVGRLERGFKGRSSSELKTLLKPNPFVKAWLPPLNVTRKWNNRRKRWKVYKNNLK